MAHRDGVKTMLHGQQSLHEDLLSLLHGSHVLRDYTDLFHNSRLGILALGVLRIEGGVVLKDCRQLLSVVGCIGLSTSRGGSFNILFVVNHGKQAPLFLIQSRMREGGCLVGQS